MMFLVARRGLLCNYSKLHIQLCTLLTAHYRSMLCTLKRVFLLKCDMCAYCDNDSAFNLVHTNFFTVWGNTLELVGNNTIIAGIAH